MNFVLWRQRKNGKAAGLPLLSTRLFTWLVSPSARKLTPRAPHHDMIFRDWIFITDARPFRLQVAKMHSVMDVSVFKDKMQTNPVVHVREREKKRSADRVWHANLWRSSRIPIACGTYQLHQRMRKKKRSTQSTSVHVPKGICAGSGPVRTVCGGAYLCQLAARFCALCLLGKKRRDFPILYHTAAAWTD